jgi:hypothetical protein
MILSLLKRTVISEYSSCLWSRRAEDRGSRDEELKESKSSPAHQITSDTSGTSEIPPLDLDKSGISSVSDVVLDGLALLIATI